MNQGGKVAIIALLFCGGIHLVAYGGAPIVGSIVVLAAVAGALSVLD